MNDQSIYRLIIIIIIITILLKQDYKVQLANNKIQMPWLTCWLIVFISHLNLSLHGVRNIARSVLLVITAYLNTHTACCAISDTKQSVVNA